MPQFDLGTLHRVNSQAFPPVPTGGFAMLSFKIVTSNGGEANDDASPNVCVANPSDGGASPNAFDPSRGVDPSLGHGPSLGRRLGHGHRHGPLSPLRD